MKIQFSIEVTWHVCILLFWLNRQIFSLSGLAFRFVTPILMQYFGDRKTIPNDEE